MDDVVTVIHEEPFTTALPTRGKQGPPGPPGPVGEPSVIPGIPGIKGPQGTPPGNVIRYGPANPVTDTGAAGDFHINTTTHFMFGPQTGGAWPAGVSLVGPMGGQGPQGVQGLQGIPGNTVLYGTADPASAIGIDGNFYINTTTHFMFGPKAAGAWTGGASLVGPKGPQGPQGVQGLPGTSPGNVIGPSSAVVDDIATYSNATGTLIKDGGKKIADLALKAGDTLTGPLVLNADPSAALGAATKQYVDGKVAAVDLSAKVSKSGDTMTGPLTLNADPTAVLHAATKQYTDNKFATIDLSTKVSKSGDTMSGGLNVAGQLTAATNYLRFGTSGSGGYIQWNGGTSYYLGSAGYLWHTGNLNWGSYVSNSRQAIIDWGYNVANGVMNEPYGGSIITGFDYGAGTARFRQWQVYTSSWWAIGYA